MTDSELSAVFAKCTEDGGCLVWGGRVTGSSGVPTDSKNRSLRRRIFIHFRNEIPDDVKVRMQCGCALCLNFDHMVALPVGELVSQAQKGRQFKPLHIAKLTIARRTYAKRNIEAARAIREDLLRMTHREVSKKHGICMSLVSKIRTNQIWREQVCPNNSVFNLRGSP